MTTTDNATIRPSEFSTGTVYLWGVLRPDGTAVLENPTPHHREWTRHWAREHGLLVAGFLASSGNPDSWERTCAGRAAKVLEDELESRGVPVEVARHKVVLFTIHLTVIVEEGYDHE